MKTKFLQTSFAVVSMLLAAAASQAQGTVNFNSAYGGLSGITNEVTGTFAPIQPGQFAFGLYVGTTTNALQSSMFPIFVVTNAGFPGVISGNIALQVPFLVAGSTYIFQVKGWSAASGAKSYEQGILGGLGTTSQIGEFTIPANPNGSPPQLFGFTGGSVPTPVFSVPEPSTMALGGLAVALVGVFRRRRGIN